MKTVQPIRDIEKVKDICAYFKSNNMRNYVLFMIGIGTGLRISDIIALRVRDVKGRLHISIKAKKTGKETIVKVNGTLKKVLDEYTKDMGEWEYLFPSRQKVTRGRKESRVTHITRQCALGVLKDAAKVIGIEDMGTHTMRKTFGYHIYMKTKNIAGLMEIYGHASEYVTLRYIGITQNRKDELVDGLSYF